MGKKTVCKRRRICQATKQVSRRAPHKYVKAMREVIRCFLHFFWGSPHHPTVPCMMMSPSGSTRAGLSLRETRYVCLAKTLPLVPLFPLLSAVGPSGQDTGA